jgi:hypothetical protein
VTNLIEWTDAQLWDVLQERFGFGDWDETTSDIPYWKFRANGIGQLKAMKRKRKVSTRDLVVAADYAVIHHRPVIALWQLFGLVPEANKWRRQQDEAVKTHLLAREIEEAIEEALDADEPEWAERLLRASRADAQTVLNEWRSR